MNEMEKIEKMFDTLVTEQSIMRQDVKQINERLTDLIRLEQQQISQDKAMNRMGAVIDEQKKRISDMNDILTDVRIASARTMTKVAMISAGSSTTVIGVLYGVLQFFTDKVA